MRLLLTLVVACAVLLAACQGCRNPSPKSDPDAAPGAPRVRLYLLSNLAGALEPCGCSKGQLGGLDHLAALIEAGKKEVADPLVLAAGPLLFIDPVLEPEHETQDRWKAEAIAGAMKHIGLRAWAPGYNDWAGGAERLAQNAAASGAAPLALGIDGLAGSQLVEVNGLRVGLLGVSDPKNTAGTRPQGVRGPDAAALTAAAKRAVQTLRDQGAQLLVCLTALPRGAALRLADQIPELHLLVVGKPSSAGHGNTQHPPAEMVGKTLVVETANHGQTVAVVDVFVQGQPEGLLALADAGGVKKAAQIADLSRRIHELEARIHSWEKGGKVGAKDLAARKAELAQLERQRAELEREQPAPPGSFFRYRVEEVREELGESDAVVARMRAYYKRVNEHNKVALADMKPPAPSDGQPSFVGIEECTLCHSEEREVFDKTAHAKAYATLEKDFKEYNLDCVGCHVTGYGKPGGSTVTHNKDLRDVQCETCHGPGSLHVKSPEDPSLIVLKPEPKSCVSQCHHPPHVDGFDPESKMELVLGPGHGK